MARPDSITMSMRELDRCKVIAAVVDDGLMVWRAAEPPTRPFYFNQIASAIPGAIQGMHRAHHGAMLREATRLIEAGKLTPNLDPRRFDLRSAELAYDAITNATARGKIVVDVA